MTSITHLSQPTPSAEPTPSALPDPRPLTDVEVVIPVYNERRDLVASIARLHEFLTGDFPYSAIITIADNASTDGTWDIAQALAGQLPGVRAVHLAEKGRGRALKQVWLASSASVVAYMDVDLSTDLKALAPLIAPLLSDHSDIAIGTRLAKTSQTQRGAKRELISRCYNLLLRAGLSAKFSDAQCGFKAMRSDAARRLLPWVQDTGWFFDSELLVLGQRTGLRIFEVPVDWTDDPDSSVDIVATAKADLHGMARMHREIARGQLPVKELRDEFGRLHSTSGAIVGQLIRFAIVGVISTLLYLAIYYVSRGFVGAQWSNVIALGLSAVANTAMNRGFTFGVEGRRGFWRHQAQGLVVFLLALLITSGSLALLGFAWPTASVVVETVVLCVANLVATVLRFTLLRSWVFSRPTGKEVASDNA